MPTKKPAAPPRPIAPGDVVAAYSVELGEWTAAQIVYLDAAWQQAGVLELDWSGPEPSGVADLGVVAPLRPTHHSWAGKLSYCNLDWVLPRSHKVIGTLPILHDRPSNSYAPEWRLGDQLAWQRRWDSGVREAVELWKAEYTGQAINEFLGESAPLRPEVMELRITEVDSLACDALVRHFPALTRLSLFGRLGLLTSAHSLNELTSLQRILIFDLFGMAKDDRLLPQRVPELESLSLHGVPAEYAAAMRSTWRPHIPGGTLVAISGARKPDWVIENRDNPLRDWDGRDHISSANYKKAVAQYKTTRRAILTVLETEPAGTWPARMKEIGRAYGEAFNKLDRRTEFIVTVERDELFAALDHIMDEADTLQSGSLTEAHNSLISGLESVRNW